MENPRTGGEVAIYSDQMLVRVFNKKNVEPRHECPPQAPDLRWELKETWAEMLSWVHAAAVSRCCLTTRKFQVWLLISGLSGNLLQLCANVHENMQTGLTGHCYQCGNEELSSLMKKKTEYPFHRTVRIKIRVSFLFFFCIPPGNCGQTLQEPLMGSSLESVPEERKRRESKPSQTQLILRGVWNNCQEVVVVDKQQDSSAILEIRRTAASASFLYNEWGYETEKKNTSFENNNINWNTIVIIKLSWIWVNLHEQVRLPEKRWRVFPEYLRAI